MSNKGISTKGNRGLADCNHAPLRALFNRCTNKPTTTLEAGDKNDIETQTVAINYIIDGVTYTAAALADENVTIAASDDDSTSQAAGTTCYYVFCIDAAGAVTCYKGVDDVAAYPAIPDGVAPFCALKVVNVTNAFTLGTTDYDATGVTATFTDIAHVPSAVV